MAPSKPRSSRFSGGPLRIFLSWSKQRSGALANELRDWLPRVIQSLHPWMSHSDIEKGSQWFLEVGRSLARSKIGIICLTPENIGNPWLLFEAGALSKGRKSNLTSRKVHNCQ
jgi:hypothetical protein